MGVDANGVNRPSQGQGRLSPLEEVRFWTQVLLSSRKTVLCSPDMRSRVQGMIDSYGVGSVITVKASRYVSDETMYVVDTDAFEAEARRIMRELRGRPL